MLNQELVMHLLWTDVLVFMEMLRLAADSEDSIPVFADLRVDFLEKKISPFMELRAGVDIAIEGASGFYGNFSFGCRLKRFSLSAGVESMKGQDYDFPYYYVGRRERVYYGNFDESADPFSFRAFNFVTRCSFEF